MTFLLDVALAMAPGGQGGGAGQEGGGLTQTLMLIVPMILIFYFFLIRPQSKRAKEHQKFLDELKRGDKVVTTGGIWGKVATVTDTTVDLDVAGNVKIRFSKQQIAGYQKGEAPVTPK